MRGKTKQRIQGSEDSHSQSSSQPSEPREEEEKCEKLDYVMNWNANVIKGMEKSTSLESFTNSSASRSSERSVDSFCHSNSSGSKTSLDSLSKSDENLANWKGPKVYNTVRKIQSMENLKQSEKELKKPELDSLLAGVTCGKCTRVRVKLLWNFEPVTKRELRVYKGEIVEVFYKEKEWLYAVKGDGKQGYIPYNYCTLVRKSDISTERKSNEVISSRKKTLVDKNTINDGVFTLLRSCSAESVMEKYSHDNRFEESVNENFDTELLIPKRIKAKRYTPSHSMCSPGQNTSAVSEKTRHVSLESTRKSSHRSRDTSGRSRKSSDRSHKVKQFRKLNCDIVRVLYDFSALDENDLTVKKNELLQVLNKEDQDWWWVRKDGGLEGFVPQNYVQSVHKRTLKVPGVPRTPNRLSIGLNQVKFQEHVVVHCYEALSDEDKDEEEELETEDIDVTKMQNSDCSTWC